MSYLGAGLRYRQAKAQQERAEQAEARVEQLEEALRRIVLHHEMPAGESWEKAYNEVCSALEVVEGAGLLPPSKEES